MNHVHFARYTITTVPQYRIHQRIALGNRSPSSIVPTGFLQPVDPLLHVVRYLQVELAEALTRQSRIMLEAPQTLTSAH